MNRFAYPTSGPTSLRVPEPGMGLAQGAAIQNITMGRPISDFFYTQEPEARQNSQIQNPHNGQRLPSQEAQRQQLRRILGQEAYPSDKVSLTFAYIDAKYVS